jgi:CarD family transcriptional regulator
MLQKGDLIVYSAHGVCQIDDICEKSFSGEVRTYLVIHPLEDPNLTINVPAEQQKDAALPIMSRDEAEQILQSFHRPGVRWIDNRNQRNQIYQEMIHSGDRRQIAQVVNTLMKKKDETERAGKKFGLTDQKLLTSVQKILFQELSIALQLPLEDVEQIIYGRIRRQA